MSMRWVGHVEWMGEEYIQGFGWKVRRYRLLGRDLKEIGWRGC
jgi:hypothetical protein